MIRALLLVLAGLTGVAAAGPLFQVTDPGSLGGGYSRAYAVNNQGEVAGESETAEGWVHAFLWREGEGIRDLGTLGGSVSRALDINHNGMVIGEAEDADGRMMAFRWSAGEGMTALPLLAGAIAGRAGAVNDEGVIVGAMDTADGTVPVFWQDGEVHRLHMLPVSGHVQLHDINDEGDIVGQVEAGPLESFISYAFYYRRAVEAPSLTTFRFISSETPSAAQSVNADGMAAGFTTSGGRAHAFLYDRRHAAEGLVDIDTLTNFYSAALGVNRQGWVVGECIIHEAEDAHAFFFNGTRLLLLDDLVDGGEAWDFVRAHGINDKGWIVGQGLQGEDERAFVLRPSGNPEAPGLPGIVPMIAMGDDGLRLTAEVVDGEPPQRLTWEVDGAVAGTAWEPPFHLTIPEPAVGSCIQAVGYWWSGQRIRSARTRWAGREGEE